MKQTLLSAIFLFFAFVGFAQPSFYFEHDTILVENITTVDEIVAHNSFTNVSGVLGSFHWTRVLVQMPENAWTSWVCDPERCYLPNGSEASFSIADNTTKAFDMHIVPSDLTEGEEVEIHIDLYDTTDTTKKAKVVYIFRVGTVQGVEDNVAKAKPILIYPNPTFDFINIKNGESVEKLVVYNIMGRAIKTFYADGLRTFDISELAEGMYLVGLFDENNNIIKTTRVSKRSLMP